MANFVLVHAAWHGGWEWRRVARILRSAGHEVFTPTLSGCGENWRHVSPGIGLDTHISDVLSLIEWEELPELVIAGHSYSGAVITGVADRIPHLVKHRVYFDAFVPVNGQSVMEITPEWRASEILSLAASHGCGWMVPPHHSERWAEEPEDRAWVERRATPHPLKTLQDRISLSGACDGIPGTYALSSNFQPSPFWQFHERYESHPNWRTVKIPTMHDAMISMPERVCEILCATL